MDINIYSNYVVKMVNKGAYKNEMGDFTDFKNEETQTLNGGELLEVLSLVLQSGKIQAVHITEETIRVEIFDYFTGEGEEAIYTITRI